MRWTAFALSLLVVQFVGVSQSLTNHAPRSACATTLRTPLDEKTSTTKEAQVACCHTAHALIGTGRLSPDGNIDALASKRAAWTAMHGYNVNAEDESDEDEWYEDMEAEDHEEADLGDGAKQSTCAPMREALPPNGWAPLNSTDQQDAHGDVQRGYRQRLVKRDLAGLAGSMIHAATALPASLATTRSAVQLGMAVPPFYQSGKAILPTAEGMYKRALYGKSDLRVSVPEHQYLWDTKGTMRHCAFNMYQSDSSTACSHGGYPALDNYLPSWLHSLTGLGKPLRHIKRPGKLRSLRCIIPNFPTNLAPQDRQHNATELQFCRRPSDDALSQYRYYYNVTLPTLGYRIETVPVGVKPDDWAGNACKADEHCNAVWYAPDLRPFVMSHDANIIKKVNREHQGSFMLMTLPSKLIKDMTHARHYEGAVLMVKAPPAPAPPVVPCCQHIKRVTSD